MEIKEKSLLGVKLVLLIIRFYLYRGYNEYNPKVSIVVPGSVCAVY